MLRVAWLGIGRGSLTAQGAVRVGTRHDFRRAPFPSRRRATQPQGTAVSPCQVPRAARRMGQHLRVCVAGDPHGPGTVLTAPSGGPCGAQPFGGGPASHRTPAGNDCPAAVAPCSSAPAASSPRRSRPWERGRGDRGGAFPESAKSPSRAVRSGQFTRPGALAWEPLPPIALGRERTTTHNRRRGGRESPQPRPGSLPDLARAVRAARSITRSMLVGAELPWVGRVALRAVQHRLRVLLEGLERVPVRRRRSGPAVAGARARAPAAVQLPAHRRANSCVRRHRGPRQHHRAGRRTARAVAELAVPLGRAPGRGRPCWTAHRARRVANPTPLKLLSREVSDE